MSYTLFQSTKLIQVGARAHRDDKDHKFCNEAAKPGLTKEREGGRGAKKSSVR